jgi:hypothetical protein
LLGASATAIFRRKGSAIAIYSDRTLQYIYLVVF